MRLENYPKEKLKKEILEIVGEHLDLNEYEVFFFGSRVSGKGDERSDIDVGIEGKEPVPFSTISAVQEKLEELPVLYKIDVVDFTGADENFKSVAKKDIELLTK